MIQFFIVRLLMTAIFSGLSIGAILLLNKFAQMKHIKEWCFGVIIAHLILALTQIPILNVLLFLIIACIWASVIIFKIK